MTDPIPDPDIEELRATLIQAIVAENAMPETPEQFADALTGVMDSVLAMIRPTILQAWRQRDVWRAKHNAIAVEAAGMRRKLVERVRTLAHEQFQAGTPWPAGTVLTAEGVRDMFILLVSEAIESD